MLLRGISGERRLRLMAGLRRFECLRDSSSVGSCGMFRVFRIFGIVSNDDTKMSEEKRTVSLLVYFN